MNKSCLLFILISISSYAGAQEINLVTLNPSETYQTITGWEGTAYIGQEHPNYLTWRDEMLDKAVNDLGLTRVRLEIRSGSENPVDYWSRYQNEDIPYQEWRSHRYATINDNNDPNEINWNGFHFSELDHTIENVVLPMKKLLEDNGEKLWINLNYVAFTGQIGEDLHYIHDNPEEYAEFVLATYLHLQDKYGWTPDTWEILLEPDNVSQWNGRLIGQAIVETAERLKTHDFNPRFVAPSNTNMGNAITYFDNMIKIPGVLDYLEEFSYHRYGGVSTENLEAIAQRAVKHGVNTAHLEWIGATYNQLHQDLEIGRNSAWAQFTIGGPNTGSDNGGSYFLVDNPDSTNPTARMANRTPLIRQYTKYIRPGAIRIDAQSNNPRLFPLAFINQHDRYVIVVKTLREQSFFIEGLPGGTYGINYTTTRGENTELPEQTITFNEYLSVEMPSNGVITIYSIKPLVKIHKSIQNHK